MTLYMTPERTYRLREARNARADAREMMRRGRPEVAEYYYSYARAMLAGMRCLPLSVTRNCR